MAGRSADPLAALAGRGRLRRRPLGSVPAAGAGLVLALWLPFAAPPARAETGDPGAAAAHDSPFAATAEMRRLARRVAAVPGGTDQRVEALVELIFDRKKGLGFRYLRHPTLTAAEAFERREGNCLTLVNLFVAMARSADIPAEFVEVEDYEAFYRYGGVIVRSDHIIAGVPLLGDLVTVDFLPDRPKRYRRLKTIGDRRATAHYYKAVATEAMLGGELERAESLFRRALDLDPGFAETWNNLAVVLRRRGDADGAIEALERARSLEPKLLPALENLSRIHRAEGRSAEADELDRRILELRTENPFYLVQLALQRLEAGKVEEARELAQRAARFRPDIPDVHLVLGRVALALDRPDEAERHFARAREKSEAFSRSFQSAVQEKIARLLAAE